VENIEKAVTDQLKAILVSVFQRCYEEWEQRLWRCVASTTSLEVCSLNNVSGGV